MRKRPTRWTAALLICVAWMGVIALAVPNLPRRDRLWSPRGGLAAAVATFGISAWSDRARWREPVQALTELTRSLRQERQSGQALTLPPSPELAELTRELAALAQAAKLPRPGDRARSPAQRAVRKPRRVLQCVDDRAAACSMRRRKRPGHLNPNMSGEFSTVDMVNRLEPIRLSLDRIEPRRAGIPRLDHRGAARRSRFSMSFRPDDRARAEKTFAKPFERGEALGLDRRVRTAHGKAAGRRGQRRRPVWRRPPRSATSAAISPMSATRFAPSASSGCAPKT